MLEYNVSKNFFKNYFISFCKVDKSEYICENKCIVPMYSKAQIYSKII